MTEKQEHLLQLFRELDEICKKNNLRYVMAGGTAIGVVRNEGFIPWDDDVDIYMPVSYTHLDVYKRQNCSSAYSRKLRHCTGSCTHHAGAVPAYRRGMRHVPFHSICSGNGLSLIHI